MRKYKNMSSLDKSISFLLNYTTRNMRRYASEVLKRENVGITIDQWGVLMLLDEHGGQLSNCQLTELMLKDRPTLTRIIDILCREGLVTRTIDQNDRRRLQVSLTAKGRKTTVRVWPLVQKLRDELSSGLTKREHADLQRALGLLNKKIDTLRDKSKP